MLARSPRPLRECRLDGRATWETTYLDDVAIWIERRVAIQLYDHPLYERRELSHRGLVFTSLVRMLLGASFREMMKRVWWAQLTSSSRPSTFNAHAGIPSPVSKFGASFKSGAVCHDWPETV